MKNSILTSLLVLSLVLPGLSAEAKKSVGGKKSHVAKAQKQKREIASEKSKKKKGKKKRKH